MRFHFSFRSIKNTFLLICRASTLSKSVEKIHKLMGISWYSYSITIKHSSTLITFLIIKVLIIFKAGSFSSNLLLHKLKMLGFTILSVSALVCLTVAAPIVNTRDVNSVSVSDLYPPLNIASHH